MRDGSLAFGLGILYAAARGVSLHDFLGYAYLVIWLTFPLAAIAFAIYIGPRFIYKEDERGSRRGRE
jgi:hypothetical protein